MHTVNFPNFLKGLDSSFNKPSNLATDNQAANDWLCDNWSLWQSLLRMNLHTRLVHPGWRITGRLTHTITIMTFSVLSPS